jgi:hypothetical protein
MKKNFPTKFLQNITTKPRERAKILHLIGIRKFFMGRQKNFHFIILIFPQKARQSLDEVFKYLRN